MHCGSISHNSRERVSCRTCQTVHAVFTPERKSTRLRVVIDSIYSYCVLIARFDRNIRKIAPPTDLLAHGASADAATFVLVPQTAVCARAERQHPASPPAPARRFTIRRLWMWSSETEHYK
jgi:hypothetical protein